MASTQSRIATLASIVATNTQRIDGYLGDQQLSQPSFDADGPVDLQLPPELQKVRGEILAATQELQELLKGPRAIILSHQHNVLLGLQCVSRFDIANRVPLDGEISYEDLAKQVNINCAALTCMLRVAISHRVFIESRPGFIAHSASSKLLAQDSRMADWLGSSVDDMWPSAARTIDALVQWPEVSEPNHTGFSLANNTTDSFYVELEKNPQRAKRFGGAMSLFLTGENYSPYHLGNGFDWSALGSGTVVDVGGSHGDIAVALTEKYPSLQIIVQDLPKVISGAPQPANPNIKFMAYDFFQEQPVKNADVYIFRWILHNWPEAYCIKILRALIPALKKGARVLVMELVMPPPGLLPNLADRQLRTMDLTMLEIGNAKERNLDEWKQLFHQADERFVFEGMQQPSGSDLAVIEIKWDV